MYICSDSVLQVLNSFSLVHSSHPFLQQKISGEESGAIKAPLTSSQNLPVKKKVLLLKVKKNSRWVILQEGHVDFASKEYIEALMQAAGGKHIGS